MVVQQISGQDNTVAGTRFMLEALSLSLDYEALVAPQKGDKKLL